VLPSIVSTNKNKKRKFHKEVLDFHNTLENGVCVSHTSIAKTTVEAKKRRVRKKCEHGKDARICRECKGSSFCACGKSKSICAEHGGDKIMLVVRNMRPVMVVLNRDKIMLVLNFTAVCISA